MTTPHEIRVFVGSTRPKSWYGQCAGLTYRTIADCGGYAPDIYGSAFAAYLATTVESRNPRNAPPGAIHYWDYTGTDDRGRVARWGHVAIDIYGGGHQVLSATGYAHEWWGEKAGLITVEAQTARGMPYLGWSRTYGRRNRLTITNPATAGSGAAPQPIPAAPKEFDEMASKQEIKDAVAEVVGGVKTNEHFLVSYASDTHRNGIVLAGFGYWHPLSFEKFDHFSWPGSRSAQGRGLFSGLEVFTPINDRAWDILREICLQDGDAEYVPISYDKIAELVTKVDVDEAALVSQITPVVAEAIKGSVGTLNDATIKVLVKALLDEQSKRLAG
ncbi:hypothetical protein [Microbacterium arborescens]|uniref:hypothetical protein n=1 Tax=Microbacterium arborescens TaxID=33883 RepID=UPI00278A161B|nr:hypothetical protein [Microbacterium arborescens]MDQ1215751.1 hypothetical protein [Microbacterium arborescens]